MIEYRASFDASVSFSNGGDLAVHGFRVDVPSPDIDEAGITALFVASLGLLMARHCRAAQRHDCRRAAQGNARRASRSR